MEKTKFYSILSNPSLLSEITESELNEIIVLFPYFQSAQILNALKAHRDSNLNAHAALKNASIHAHDRAKIKFWINTLDAEEVPSSFGTPVPITDEIETTTIVEADPVSESDVEAVIEQTTEALSAEIEAETEAYNQTVSTVEPALSDDLLHHAISMSVTYNIEDIVEKPTIDEANTSDIEDDSTEPENTTIEEPNEEISSLDTFSAKLSALAHGINASPVKSQELPKEQLEEKRNHSKKLIDTFIAKNPSSIKINQYKTEHDMSTQLGQESVKDESAMVSETLAKIYAAQGNNKKAISTYEKLMLLNPKKKTYFAELIENLKKKE